MARRFITWTAGGVAALLLAAAVPLVAAASPSGTGQAGWDARTGRLDPGTFTDPPATDRPHAFWFWNGKLTEDELSRQLDEMKAKGIEEFFIHPRQGLGGDFGVTENGYYLSKDYFDKVGFALAEAKRRGMKAWLYDDLNWPSGFAGGRTVSGGDVDGRTVPADPDYLPWYLTPVAKDVTGPVDYDQPVPVSVPSGWSVSEGVLTVNGGEVGLAKDGADWSGYRMEFDLTVDALSGGWTMHSRDAANLVMVNLTTTSPYNPEAASTFGVHVRVNGAYQLVGARIPAGTTMRDGERHHVATDIRGDTVTLFLDGREVGSRSDPRIGALAKGRVGLRSGQDERARFDNLKVTALDGGATLLADDFSAGLARWDVTQSPASSLVAAVALRKRGDGSCVTSGQARGSALDGDSAVELTGKVGADGRLRWDVPEGHWCLLHLVQRPLVNYHPDLEPDQPYVDMLNPQATQKFIDITHETYARRFGDDFGSTIQGIFNDEPGFYNNFPDNRGGVDSLGSIPWTPGFREYLTGNAGYDLTGRLAALWYDTGAATTKTRIDYYDALSDRYNEAHTKPLADWAAGHHIALISNPLVEEDLGSHRLIEGGSWFEMSKHYQLPGMDLISGLDTNVITPKLNSSVAHLFDRKRNLAETFGAFGWDLSMEEMKRAVAWEVAGGVDLIDNHAFYYSIDGQRRYESQPSEFFQNTFWPRFGAYASFTGRLVEPARGATPVNPVGLLYPSSSVMAEGTPWTVRGFAGNGPGLSEVDGSWKGTSNALLAAQLDFDYLDELALAGDPDLNVGLTVDEGRLRLHDQTFQALVMPKTTVLSLEALAAAERLVAQGGTLVAVDGLPTREAEGRDVELRQRLTALFGTDPAAPSAARRTSGAGGLAVYLPSRADLAATLKERIDPGVTLSPASPDIRVRHVKRAADDAVLVTNLSAATVRTDVTVSVPQVPEIWDPETGRTDVAPVFRLADDRVTVPMQLRPYQATWLVLRPGAHPIGQTPHATASNAPVSGIAVDGEALRARVAVDQPGDVYVTGRYRGETYGGTVTVDDPLTPIALDGPWQFRFDREGAQTVARPLGSWTALDPAFSGTGVYRRDVDIPDGFRTDGLRVLLDLGSVRDLAAVSVNGSPPRHVDWQPYTLDVTDLLREGTNTVEVRVTNTQTNAFEGRANPSGLLGPVVLRPQRVLDVTLGAGEQVRSLALAAAPASARVLPGGSVQVTAVIDGIAPDRLSGALAVSAPDGWTVQPASQRYDVASSGTPVTLRPTATVTAGKSTADGTYEVKLTATGDDGRTATATVQVVVTHSLVAWEFARDGDAEGWTAASQLTPFTVSGGVLATSTTGGDPFLVQSQPLSPDLAQGLTVEVTMSTSVSSQGQVFWTTAAQGGFSEDKSARFAVTGGPTRTYTITIPAQGTRLTGLRLDPTTTQGDIRIDAIRILPGGGA
ncbi:glycosyl hydrolase [Micromonospora sp. 4G57]|uniref:Glycosyl hydrolase n=1 Tax=Micromonospora sicca TaxID=2202420 RepID=A0ABU5JBL5_9ACTN|nr:MULTISPECIES: glycosyl hydrolase [unclassified Micromonospora]MDZ5441541.1 glycosyl hydrolase [Micromonospora sp. 4G57]MDZ5489938.1 glycosyl hydrolase [Micromonospora sp. 4G53]